MAAHDAEADDDSGLLLRPASVPAGGPRAERDPLFWTELEIRRLGNRIAAALHGPPPQPERAETKILLDAMRRKSLRVLTRAEKVANDPGSAWPGLDPGVRDPIALAEEYVAAVTQYVSAFELGADAAPAVVDTTSAAKPNGAAEGDDLFAGAEDEWAGDDAWSGDDAWADADARAYQAAVAAARAEPSTPDAARAALLGEGPRQRRGTGANGARPAAKLSAADEALMRRHQPVQDQLTKDLADVVGRLKGSVSGIGEQLKRDDAVLDEAADAVDANLGGISRQRDELAGYANATRMGWWRLMVIAVIVMLVFTGALILIKLPI